MKRYKVYGIGNALVDTEIQVEDQELESMGVEKGRATRPDIKLGICGEHGGDPASIAFCESVGLDYVSASPYRVPIARLAAAQASMKKV